MSGLLQQTLIALGITSFCTFSLAVFVSLQRIKASLKWPFVLYSLALAVWSASQAVAMYLPDPVASLIVIRLGHIGIVLIPVFFIHFAFGLAGALEKKKNIIPAFYLAGAAFVISDATPYLVPSVSLRPPHLRYIFDPGILYPVFLAFWVATVIYAFTVLLKTYYASSPISRSQVRYFLLGTLIGYAGGSPNFLFGYNVVIPGIMPFGTYAVALYVGMTAYAIVRHRLLDINLAVTRVAIFVLVYAPLLLMPIVVGKASEPWLSALFGANWWMIPMGVEALFAAGGLVAYRYVQKKAEDRLRAEELEAHRKLRELSQDMLRFTELKPLLDQVVHQVVKVLKVTHAAVYLTDPEDGSCKRQSAWGPAESAASLPESVPEDSAFIRDLAATRLPRVREELKLQQQAASPDWQTLGATMDQLRAAVAIPAFKPERFFGFLALGDKRSGRIWTQDDLNMLTLLANQAALAIENVQLHEAQADRLIEEAVDKTAIQLARGVGHQFGNTLNDIKLLAETFLHTLKSKPPEALSPAELLSFLLRAAKILVTIAREAGIGGGIATGVMNLTKPVPQEFKPVEMRPIFEESIARVLQKHAAEKVEDEAVTPAMLNGVPKTLPKVSGNDAQIRQVFYNILDNAVDAIREKIFQLHKGWLPAPPEPYKGRVQIKAQESGGRLTITIEDDGIGITPENMKDLFGPYFTTKGHSKGRGLGGHGAGLFVIKKIIEAHGGKIRVASEPARWTRFTIDLPVWRESHGA